LGRKRSRQPHRVPYHRVMVRIVGGGLAGCEAAWQAAALGVPVTIYEMRPAVATPVHKTDRLAELVCSNSFRGDKLDNAVGLLKEEMRRLGSIVMRVGDRVRVPAGAAMAVDREAFAAGITEAMQAHPLIRVEREAVTRIPESRPDSPVIIATGPLTSAELSAAIAAFVGQEHLAFYDAISPIVLAETIDMTKVFRQSRWDRSLRSSSSASPAAPESESESGISSALPQSASRPERATAGTELGGRPPSPLNSDGDYLNCPLSEDEYRLFYDALVSAEKAAVHDFDNTKFFEGCLPIEVMAHRGVDTLRFGPMKPAGLRDPRTGRRPYAVVQLRQDNLAGDHYSLVGFQTQLKWGEQARVLRLIPGLEHAEFVRFGMIHRNTYINAPTVLTETWQTRARADLFFAGQISGVEGYVESAASGLIAGCNAARLVLGLAPLAAPRTTAIGALAYYVSHADARYYQPSNITFGIMPPLPSPPKGRPERATATSERALLALQDWLHSSAHLVPSPA
jgi:methylenetetrahydrofolate--tRNA-(uracil-5-)-methyltransferase